MGCVSSVKQSKKHKAEHRRPTTSTEPTLIHDQLDLKDIKQEVSNRACGYHFEIAEKIGRGKNQGMQENGPLQEFSVLVQKCRHYFTNHDIDTAHQHLLKVNEHLKKYNHTEYNQDLQKIRKQNAQILHLIEQEYEEVIMYQNQILKGGWVEKSNRKGVRVSTRREETTVGVLVESIVEEPFQVLITFCIEMDLYKEFMPFMKLSRQQKIVARNCRIGYTQNHIPIVSIRQSFFQGIGYNRLNKNNTLFLFTRSIHNRPQLQKKLGYKCKINQDFVQLEYKYFVLWYQPIAKGKGRITLAMNIDTKLKFIPMWIQDKISQDFGEQFFQNIVQLSKKFKGSMWERNTNANPELFLFFKGAVDRRLEEMEKQEKLKSKEGMPGTQTSTSTNLNTNI